MGRFCQEFQSSKTIALGSRSFPCPCRALRWSLSRFRSAIRHTRLRPSSACRKASCSTRPVAAGSRSRSKVRSGSSVSPPSEFGRTTLAERDHELADAPVVGVKPHLARLPASLAAPRVACDDHLISLLRAEDLDLVVRRLFAVRGLDRIAAHEGTCRDALKAHLGVFREPRRHRREVTGTHALVEAAHVLLEKGPWREVSTAASLEAG